jgi:peptidoglycan/xylan/chitin deacetylase (PgdA/CDA1 family)
LRSEFGAGPFILMYHSIVNGSDDACSVSVDNFKKQVSWLFDSGFTTVHLEDLVKSLNRKDWVGLRKKVVFTFDDGCKDFVSNALPVLQRHKASATVFLVTGMMGGRASWSTRAGHVPLMSADEVRHIKTLGISLGSHTVTHADLTALNPMGLHRQVKDSRDCLTYFGESFYSFAFPWGRTSAEVKDAVRQAGYECAVAVGGAMRVDGTDIYQLPRMAMQADLDFRAFRALFGRTSRLRRYLNRFVTRFLSS